MVNQRPPRTRECQLYVPCSLLWKQTPSSNRISKCAPGILINNLILDLHGVYIMRNTGGGGWMAPEKKNYDTGNMMFAGEKNIISK